MMTLIMRRKEKLSTGMLLRVLIVFLICLTSSSGGFSKSKYSSPGSGCSLNTSSSAGQGIDVYWINLDRSVDRRHFMLDHLNFYNLHSQHRVKALLPNQIYVPPELALPNDCLSLTDEATMRMVSELQRNHSGSSSSNSNSYVNSNGGGRKSKVKIFVQAHCGRKKNTRRELTVTLSHLLAIRSAIYDDSGSGSPYALILEDDLQLAFQVDFPALIRSSPNPSGFGVLQLVTSNEFSVLNLQKVYNLHRALWVKRRDKDDYWCAGAYIINKPVLKQFVDAIFAAPGPGPGSAPGPPPQQQQQQQQQQQLSRPATVKIIAGYQAPCWPKYCCNGSALATGAGSACVHAARGYQSDHFIYSLAYAETYMLTLPLVTGAAYGNTSTLHQDHVSFHVSAFNRINSIVAQMVSDEKYRPSFLNDQCMFNRTAAKVLKKST